MDIIGAYPQQSTVAFPATLVTCACRDAEIRDSLVPPAWEEEIKGGRVCVWLRIIYAIRAMWSHELFNNMKPLFEEQKFKGPVPTARSKSARCHGKGSSGAAHEDAIFLHWCFVLEYSRATLPLFET